MQGGARIIERDRYRVWDLSSERTPMTLTAICIAAVGAIATVAFMATVPFSGDEHVYVSGAETIADFVTGRAGSLEDVTKQIVRQGWWMPGMSFVMTPLYVVAPDASVGVARAYTMGVLVLLSIWTTRELETAFGSGGRLMFVIFPTLAMMWLVFAATAWGDLPAGLCVAIVAARTYRLGIDMLEQVPVSMRDIGVAELVMVAMVYLRGNTILVVVTVHVLLVSIAIVSRQWSRMVRRLGLLAAGVALFGAMLAPWSLTASRVLGDPVVTTSSAPLAVGVTFGDANELCFGPCPPEGVWAGEVRFSRRYARRHGISPLEAQRRMAYNALRDVTLRDYAVQVRDNFRAFVDPVGAGPRRGTPFMDRFIAISELELKPATAALITGTVRIMTLAVYVPFFAALVLVNVAVFIRTKRLQMLSLLVKVSTVSLFVQPFVHESHSRYWPVFAPVMTIAAVLVVAWWRGARANGSGDRASGLAAKGPLDVQGRSMVGIQSAYVVAIVGVAVALMLA